MQSFSTRHELFALFIRFSAFWSEPAGKSGFLYVRTCTYVYGNVRNYAVCKTYYVRSRFFETLQTDFIPMGLGSFFRGSKRPSFSHHRSASQIFLYCRANFPPPASSLRHKVLPCDKRLSISLTICIPPALLIASRGLFGCPPGPHNISFLFFGSNPIIVIDKQNRPQISNHCKNRS